MTMSDDVIEDRLRRAGERWRTVHVDPAAVNLERALPTHEPGGPRRRWVAAASGFVVAAAVALGLVLVDHGGSSGGGPAATPAGQLLGRWTILAVRDQQGQAVVPVTDASFTIANGPTTGALSILGSDGVNSFQGAVTVRGDRLDVGQLAVSAVGAVGPNAAGTIDAILSGRATWSVVGSRLTLSNSAGTIVAAPVYPQRTAALIGTRWQLTTIEAGGAASPATGPGAAYLQLDPGGVMRWSDGCNDLTGTVSADGEELTIRPASQPNVGCGGNAVVSQPATLARVLTGRVTWAVAGDQLTLTKGGSALVYVSDLDPGFTGASPGPTQVSTTSTR
jgi:heat shock protein HslJ